MTKEKQKMTLNVRRRINGPETKTINPTQTPPITDPVKLAAFAGGIEQSSNPIQAHLTVQQSEPVPLVVRDAFTMPAEDHALFAEIQKKCLALGIVTTKSEILRASIKHFVNLEEKALVKAINAVPKIKTGRPSNKQL